MKMLEIKITVSCPDLVLAATALAKCLRPHNAVETTEASSAPTASVMSAVPASAVPASAVPASAVPTMAAAPSAPAVPVAAIAPSMSVGSAASSVPAATVAASATPPVPLAAAPQYSLDQIARAGADLVTREPAKAAAAQQLLVSFGVQTVSDLPKERFGEFVTALRGLGASI